MSFTVCSRSAWSARYSVSSSTLNVLTGELGARATLVRMSGDVLSDSKSWRFWKPTDETVQAATQGNEKKRKRASAILEKSADYSPQKLREKR